MYLYNVVLTSLFNHWYYELVVKLQSQHLNAFTEKQPTSNRLPQPKLLRAIEIKQHPTNTCVPLPFLAELISHDMLNITHAFLLLSTKIFVEKNLTIFLIAKWLNQPVGEKLSVAKLDWLSQAPGHHEMVWGRSENQSSDPLSFGRQSHSSVSRQSKISSPKVFAAKYCQKYLHKN